MAHEKKKRIGKTTHGQNRTRKKSWHFWTRLGSTQLLRVEMFWDQTDFNPVSEGRVISFGPN